MSSPKKKYGTQFVIRFYENSPEDQKIQAFLDRQSRSRLLGGKTGIIKMILLEYIDKNGDIPIPYPSLEIENMVSEKSGTDTTVENVAEETKPPTTPSSVPKKEPSGPLSEVADTSLKTFKGNLRKEFF